MVTYWLDPEDSEFHRRSPKPGHVMWNPSPQVRGRACRTVLRACRGHSMTLKGIHGHCKTHSWQTAPPSCSKNIHFGACRPKSILNPSQLGIPGAQVKIVALSLGRHSFGPWSSSSSSPSPRALTFTLPPTL